MSRSFPWYKHYPDRFLVGVAGMSAEEIGCYIVVLDLIYDHGGPIPYEPKRIAAIIDATPRKINGLVQALLKRGKLVRSGDILSNPAAEEVIEKQREQAENHAKNGQKGGKIRSEIERRLREINGLDGKRLKHTRAIDTTKTSSLTSNELVAEEKVGKREESGAGANGSGYVPSSALLQTRLMRKAAGSA